MSSIVTSALNLTFGLLWEHFRDHTANKLKEGDLTDEICRELIVRELDDIKTKLDGLSRKDLLSSISFLKEGLCLLNLSLYKPSNDETSFAQEKKVDLSQGEASKMMVAGSDSKHHGGDSLLNEAWSLMLSEAIRALKIVSRERFTSSKRAFEKSNTKATEAFSNEALSTEDRILATKLRVISRILESLEDPDAAANTCKLYLKELHEMPAVRETFSVYLGGGIKSHFNKRKRLENVVSVTMVNLEVFNFTKKLTEMPVYLFNWPIIDLGGRPYHPLCIDKTILCEVEKFEVQTALTVGIVIPKEIYKSVILETYAVNSKGEIIAVAEEAKSYNIVRIIAGEVQRFCSLPQEETEVDGFEILSLTIDGEDNIYIITRCKLFVFDATGSIRHHSLLEFLNGNEYGCMITVSKLKTVFVHKHDEGHVYVCDSSGQLKYSFPLEEESREVLLSISDENEIIAAPSQENIVYIYTEEGKLTRRFQVPEGHKVLRVAFNYVTKEIIVISRKTVLIYSKTGEQRQTFAIPHVRSTVISHPSGSVALIVGKEVFWLQK